MIDVSARALPEDFSLADTDEFDNGLSADLRARIKRELEPGERLVWSACSLMPPFQVGPVYLCVAAITLVLMVSGIVILAFCLGQPGARADFMPASVIFLGMGGAFAIGLIGNWIARQGDRRRKGGVCNAVTDRRAIVWTPEPERDAIRVQSVGKGQVAHLSRIERQDGSGILEISMTYNDFDSRHRLTFENIPDVRRVEQIVRNNLLTSERST